uniref:Uncharacterized protein n=1 Tax=Candidatus Kentrum sp. UNK TaxID=2126344 RepID=A0A451ARD9_9GAMM|nr:MAG: hypothetical protein BECKUNK1418G_GA0071005_100535 [Candidatus Kentron sp. UNK]VFK68614.1 MAG: hypothetical protein BECKUNK1418H_GA0071006_100435 [Candidatus Kentron sp. UNK]
MSRAKTGYHSLAFTPTAATFHLRVAWKSGAPQVSRAGLASGALILGSPFGKDHTHDLQHDASEDITFIAHRDYKPRKLGRHGHASWSLTPYRPASDPFTGAGHYPRAVRFHKGRLWFGGAGQRPRTLWASQSKAPFDMTTGAEDEKALIFTLLEQNPILWLASGRDLALGTLGNEQVITGDDGLITATNIDVSRHTSHGSSRVSPVQYNNQILFVDRSTRQLRAFAYDYANIDGYRGPDISLWGEHLLRTGVAGLALAAKPTPTLWLHDEDGRLRALTYEPEQDVLAWHDHPLGGDGRVESMTTTPFGRSDRLYLATRREFEGQTIRALEYLEDGEWDGIENAFYVDAGLSYAGDASATFSGLSHLEGQTVSILADGIPHRPLVVQGGAVTLDHPAATCHIGLGYESIIETLPLEIQTKAGTAQGARKSWRDISVRLLESMGGTVNGQEILYRTPGDNMDQAIPPFSGDKEIDDLGWDDEGTVTIQQTGPLPMTVQSIFGKVKMA